MRRGVQRVGSSRILCAMVRGIVATSWLTALLLTGAPVLAAEAVGIAAPPGRAEARGAPGRENWLGRVNSYRIATGLWPVRENLLLSAGDRCHAIYTVKNEVVQHSEESGNRFFTPLGRAAAAQSNLFLSDAAADTDSWVIDTWMQSPFHAVGLLDPRLRQVGYGSYREPGGVFETGAALNVAAGLEEFAAVYPIFWPGNRSIVPLGQHWVGSPSPLHSCPGYVSPSGLPLIIQFGPGDQDPVVTASSLSADGQPLEHCVFSESTYRNPDLAQQELGRSILAERDAVVLVPRVPLTPGAHYTASITVGGRAYEWSFGVEAPATNRQETYARQTAVGE